MAEMAKRNRTNSVQFYLDDEEQYILDRKFKLSGMKSKSAFLRKLILYGYVYDVDYSYLRNYNTELGRMSLSFMCGITCLICPIISVLSCVSNTHMKLISSTVNLLIFLHLPL